MQSQLLQHCAQTLLDFNGGASCVQVYVNQHDFFINRVGEKAKSEDKLLQVLLLYNLLLLLTFHLDGSPYLILTWPSHRQKLV